MRVRTRTVEARVDQARYGLSNTAEIFAHLESVTLPTRRNRTAGQIDISASRPGRMSQANSRWRSVSILLLINPKHYRNGSRDEESPDTRYSRVPRGDRQESLCWMPWRLWRLQNAVSGVSREESEDRHFSDGTSGASSKSETLYEWRVYPTGARRETLTGRRRTAGSSVSAMARPAPVGPCPQEMAAMEVSARLSQFHIILEYNLLQPSTARGWRHTRFACYSCSPPSFVRTCVPLKSLARCATATLARDWSQSRFPAVWA